MLAGRICLNFQLRIVENNFMPLLGLKLASKFAENGCMAKILIIDDNTMICRIWKIQLEKIGHDVVCKNTAEDALEYLKTDIPDLVLSDVMMPGKSGLDMVREIRMDDTTRDIPVIVLSALNSLQTKETAQSLGVCRYIVKSEISLTELGNIVNEVLTNQTA